MINNDKRTMLIELYNKHYFEYMNASAKEVSFKYGQFLGVRNCLKQIFTREELEKIYGNAVMKYEQRGEG